MIIEKIKKLFKESRVENCLYINRISGVQSFMIYKSLKKSEAEKSSDS
jgi:hypothetical protein